MLTVPELLQIYAIVKETKAILPGRARLLQIYAIVKETKAILPGRARLLAALDRAIDDYPRPTEGQP